MVALLVLLVCLYHVGYGHRRLTTRSHAAYLQQLNITFENLPEQLLDESDHRRTLSEASHRVSMLPGLEEPEPVHYAGHVTIDESKGSNIFYWLFEAPQNADNLPLLVWMNGGPGCSSMDGLWLELGPFRLDKSGERVSLNPHSWHNVANLLFIDQPVGTGFAYTKSKAGYANNDEAVNVQFYKFLLEFFKLHPRYVQTIASQRTTRSFFMSGESHAGHYIPSMAAYILQKNDAIRRSGSEDPIVTLEGIALGEFRYCEFINAPRTVLLEYTATLLVRCVALLCFVAAF
jgi:carboxypeptidase C (cathepsin A)